MLIPRMQHFAIPVNPPANPQLGLILRVDLDAPFLLSGVVIWNLGVNTDTGQDGQIAIRIIRPDGRTIQRQLTASNQLFPGSQYGSGGVQPNKALVCPIRPGVLFPAGSVIEMDVMGLDTGIASPAGSIVVFQGTNFYQEGNIWNPSYPAKWTALPYLDNLTVPGVNVPGNLPLLNQPFTAQADSDFVWQAGMYSDFTFAGTRAHLLVATGENLNFKLTAVTPGVAGNSISFQVISSQPTPNVPFSITVVGDVITTNCGTTAGGANQDILTFIANLQATPAFNALVTIGPPIASGPATDFPATFMSGGSAGGASGAVAQLLDLGVIVRDPAYKAYSNTYIPIALLFPFLSSQAPGWLYPEIYIPRLGQIYFDFNYLVPGFVAASPLAITLGMKGMKVYPQ